MNVRKIQREIDCLNRKLNRKILWQWQMNDINDQISRLTRMLPKNLYNGFESNWEPAVLVEVDGVNIYMQRKRAYNIGAFNYIRENG